MSMLYTVQFSQPLSHAGILGMRWHRRRFQNEDGTLTEEGKIRLAERRGRKDRLKGLSEENRQKAIESIVRTGNVDAAYKYRNYMTDSQLTAVIARQELNSRLLGKTSKEIKKAAAEREKLEALKAEEKKRAERIQKLKDAPATAERAVKGYNVAAAIFNGVLGEKALPLIDMKLSEKKEKDDETKSEAAKKLEKELEDWEREYKKMSKTLSEESREYELKKAKSKDTADAKEAVSEPKMTYGIVEKPSAYGGGKPKDPADTGFSRSSSEKGGSGYWTSDKTFKVLREEPELASKIFAIADARGLDKRELAVFAKVATSTLADNELRDGIYDDLDVPYYD